MQLYFNIYLHAIFLLYKSVFKTLIILCSHGAYSPNKELNQIRLYYSHTEVNKADSCFICTWWELRGDSLSLVIYLCVFVFVCVCQSVCGWTDWLSYGQTLYMVGMLLGSLFGGAISDR